MLISIDAEKAFYKTQHPILIHSKNRMSGFLKIWLCVCTHTYTRLSPKDSIRGSGRTLTSKGSTEIRNKARKPTVSTSAQHCTEAVADPNRQEKSIRDITEKEDQLYRWCGSSPVKP